MYEINEIYPAIQGEGYHAGMPCTIVRMQGCNLRCSFCDTPQAQQAGLLEKWPLENLLKEIEGKLTPSRIVLITGGEPLLQDLGSLTEAIYRRGIKAHLETNGTLPPTGAFTWITVSPKAAPCNPSIVERANEVKWLVATEEDVIALILWKERLQWHSNKIVSLQPISILPTATKICYDACIKYGWRLSLQLHRYIGTK